MREKKMKATLRIASRVHSVNEITELLGKKPSSFSVKGTPINPRDPNSRLRVDNKWILKSGLSESKEMQEHIEKLLKLMEKRSEQIKNELKDSEIDIICIYSCGSNQLGGGFVFTDDLLKRLAVFSIYLIFDIYTFPCPE